MPRDSGHERHRHKHRDNGERGGNNRKPDFIGCINRRPVRGFAHTDMALDILDLDYCVIHQNPGGECNGQERDQVQREAEQVHHIKRRDRRQRQGHGGNQCRPPVPQEQQHDQDRQNRPFDQRGDRRFVIAIGGKHVVDHDVDGDAGIFSPDLVQRCIGLLGHADFGRARGTKHGKDHNFIAVVPGKGLDFLVGIGDGAKVGQSDLPT